MSWTKESTRHALASRGVRTTIPNNWKNKSYSDKRMIKQLKELEQAELDDIFKEEFQILFSMYGNRCILQIENIRINQSSNGKYNLVADLWRCPEATLDLNINDSKLDISGAVFKIPHKARNDIIEYVYNEVKETKGEIR
ncbi:hypothetical protein AKJ51_01465 [candidate division MSBL1 archaeon SCGC-AAA382A20]|uniref:Uncharacterized protein n=1 Tax=candidate division MSBL1 archaeon SCGC-AAA382A20 TaxID=1698280 RepID=A0A133VLT2_9EURY|nr:hypothetical protein AKJ51_01465 [candidate division MSBL1 archaeon SCGC-AAA382A20]